MSRPLLLIVLGILIFASVDAGRLIQEDPSWNKDETPNEPMVMVPEAPDDFVGARRRHSRQQQQQQQQQETVATSTTLPPPPTTEESVDETLDTILIESTTTTTTTTKSTQTERGKRGRFYTSWAPTKRIKRRGSHTVTDNQKLMVMPAYQTNNGEGETKDKNRRLANELDKQLMEDEEGEEDSESITRAKRQFAVWTPLPHVLPLEMFFWKFNVTTPIYPYGKCWVSLGHQKNPGCLGGEVCVDKDSGTHIECSITTPCPACATGNGTTGAGTPGPGPPPVPAPPTTGPGGTAGPTATGGTAGPITVCPRGCLPGAGCPPPSGDEDGVCADPVRRPEEYDYTYELSTTYRTPQVYYSGSVAYGEPCSVYGDLIDESQKSDLEFNAKAKRLKGNQETGNLGSHLCNWVRARLQCIPNKPRLSTTTPAGAPPPTDQDIEGSKRPAGTCKCIVALGEEAVVVRDPKTFRDICYIPANKGPHSDCDHEIIMPPYGNLDGLKSNGAPVHRGAESASKFCVPNAECRPGYKYTGLRCMCKKKGTWNPKTYTCNKTTRMSGKYIGFVLGIIYLLRVVNFT